MLRIIAPLGRALAGILFPRLCAGCDANLGEAGTDFCERCAPAMAALVARPYCTRCGESTGPAQLPENVCPDCRKGKAPTDGIARVAAYDGLWRRLIRQYKFHGRYDLLAPAVRMLAARLNTVGWLDQIDAFVSVPTHWTRRSLRSEYLAGQLARGVAGAHGRSCQQVVRRIRGGPNQYELTSPAQRMENVRGAFAVASGARLDGASVCLVDDITTTGATLAEVRRVLKRAGAARVYAAVLAKAGWS
jgi:ComF family protein